MSRMFYILVYVLLFAGSSTFAQQEQDLSVEKLEFIGMPCPEIFRVAKEEINIGNAQEYFVFSSICRRSGQYTRGNVRVGLDTKLTAINYMGGRANNTVLAIHALELFEGTQWQRPNLPGAWGNSTAIILNISPQFDVRESFYAIAAFEIQNRILRGTGSPDNLPYHDLDILVFLQRIFEEIGYQAESINNIRSICFVKSDVGGSVHSTINAARYEACLLGD